MKAMKRTIPFFWGSCALVCLSALAADPSPLKTDAEKQSYAVGIDMARHFQRSGVAIDAGAMERGMHDQFHNLPSALSEEQLKDALNGYQAAAKAAADAVAKANARDGDRYRADYATRPGVVKMSNGLLYRVLKEGSGNKPTDLNTIECNYEGRLIDGTVFENSKVGEPLKPFKLDTTVPGFREAVKLIAPGGQIEAVVPPSMAYGAAGVGKIIGPNATLIFTIDLLAIK